jgi:hypothetical protein
MPWEIKRAPPSVSGVLRRLTQLHRAHFYALQRLSFAVASPLAWAEWLTEPKQSEMARATSQIRRR